MSETDRDEDERETERSKLERLVDKVSEMGKQCVYICNQNNVVLSI